MAVCVAKELSFTYPGTQVPALRDVNLSIAEGAFWVLMGGMGSGKTTLLRHFKPTMTPCGTRKGQLAHSFSDREIGYLFQSPEDQLVCDRVLSEMAFGLENRNTPPEVMTRKVAEVADFFGIESWMDLPCAALSGGQVQLLNLAALLTTDPKLLLLDEPAAQLDPAAAAKFYQMLRQVHEDFGITVVLCGHRLEMAMPLADHVALLSKGRITAVETPKKIGRSAPLWLLPPTMGIAASVDKSSQLPLTVGEGKQWLQEHAKKNVLTSSVSTAVKNRTPCLQAKGLTFGYQKGRDLLRDLDLTLYPGEIYGLFGGNGCGKSTLLQVLLGNRKAYRGKIRLDGNVVGLPQNPKAVFCHETVEEELKEMGGAWREAAKAFSMDAVFARHPYDLSGGQMQLLALLKLSLVPGEIYLLDEPTTGLDGQAKSQIGAMLKALARKAAVCITSHDVEFCAAYATRCGMLFDGRIVGEGQARDFFAGNRYYTTAASRMARGICKEAVTAEDVIMLCEND